MSTGLFYVIILALTVSASVSEVDISSIITEKEDWLTNFLQNKNLDVEQTDDPSLQISRKCLDDMRVYAAAFIAKRVWAAEMMDSNGERLGEEKPPPGTLEGNTHWLGSWEECEGVKATNQSFKLFPGPDNIHYHDWDAKYCRYYFWKFELRYSSGRCVPETCTESDVAMIVWSNFTGPITAVYCGRENDFGSDADAIAATVILSIFGLIIISATLLDYYMLWKNKLSKKKEAQVKGQQGEQLDESKAACSGDAGDIALSATVAKTDDVEMGHIYSNPVEVESEEGNAGTPQAEDDTSTQTNHIAPLECNGHTGIEDGVVKENSQNSNSPTDTSTTSEGSTLGKKCLATLLAFSMKRNVSQMVSTYQPSGSYKCMHGMRVFTMLWIIFGHTWQLGIYVNPDPSLVAVENRFVLSMHYFTKWQHAVINNMSIAVDTFFLLSGALITISLMKQFGRLRQEMSGHLQRLKMVGLHFLHRYWRLTPVYAMILMMYACYFRYFEKGPLWTKTFFDADSCKKTWWANLLYINIYVAEPCMGWTWYLANDFQFYIIAPIFVVFMFLYPIYGCIFLFLGYAGQLVATSVILTDETKDWMTDYYVKPMCRFGTYAVGMALGFIMFHTKCKAKIPKWGVALGWILAIGCGVTTVFGSYWIDQISCTDEEACGWTIDLRYAYDILFRDVFAVCIAWLVFACCAGYGGIVNTFLSWKFFVPLSRLTYAGYLIHPIIIYYQIYSRMRLLYIQNSVMALFFCGYVLMTFGAAFVLSLMFEVPMLAMEKVLLPQQRK